MRRGDETATLDQLSSNFACCPRLPSLELHKLAQNCDGLSAPASTDRVRAAKMLGFQRQILSELTTGPDAMVIMARGLGLRSVVTTFVSSRRVSRSSRRLN